MAARSMAARNMNPKRIQFLPAALKQFLQRRMIEMGGITLFVAALALALALVSFNPADPNFNHATRLSPANWLGRPGAFTADLLLQTLGLAGGLPVLMLAAWGWRVVSHRGLPWWWLNIALLPLTLTFTACALAILPVPGNWPLKAGIGGVVGDFLLYGEIAPRLAMLDVPLPEYVASLSFFLLSFPALMLALGLSREEWRGMAEGIGNTATVTANGLVDGASIGSAVINRAGTMAGGGLTALRDKFARKEPRLVSDDVPDQDREEQRPTLRATADDEPKLTSIERPEVRVEKRKALPREGKRASAEAQKALKLNKGDYQLPELDLLSLPTEQKRREIINEDALEQNARMLESVLNEFGVTGQIIKVRPGPVVTLYELEPAPGTKSSRVIGLADDIARSMSALSARVAVIPGRNAIGIELPNAKRETVFLRELLASAEFETQGAKLALGLGKDIGGTPVIADLARMPHLLVAGTTGSGKSVAVNTMILSLLYRLTPEQCRFIMIDPKMLELSVYEGIPHLLAPVVTEPGKAVVALKWAVREMEERYRRMSELGVRNVAGYNQRLAEARARGEKLGRTVQTGFDPESGKPIFEERPLDLKPLPFIVVIVDEFADLMLVAGKDVEAAIQRLAQMARAAGIHLILATQRPSVDVITGTIKANFPTRISFQVTSKIDSRTILGEQGAEQLLGMGDMLFMPGAGRIQRVHGPFVSDEEVEKVVTTLKSQGAPDYLEAVTADPDEGGGFGMPGGSGAGGEEDQLYDQAVALVCRERKASTSFIQRHLRIGYNNAARIIERMEKEGVVGAANHVGKREVIARDIGDVGAARG